MKETSAYWISFIRFAKWTTASYFGYIIQIVATAKEVGVPPPMLHRSVFLLSKSEVPLKLKINFTSFSEVIRVIRAKLTAIQPFYGDWWCMHCALTCCNAVHVNSLTVSLHVYRRIQSQPGLNMTSDGSKGGFKDGRRPTWLTPT